MGLWVLSPVQIHLLAPTKAMEHNNMQCPKNLTTRVTSLVGDEQVFIRCIELLAFPISRSQAVALSSERFEEANKLM